MTIPRSPARATGTIEAIVKAADGLALLECNPVSSIRRRVVVDATAQEVAT